MSHIFFVALVLAMSACSPPGAGAEHRVEGRAVAGPVCPVQPVDPSDGCQPKPVAGATLVISDAGGNRVATVVTAEDGSWFVSLGDGSYAVEPQPVHGMMATAPPVQFMVRDDQPAEPVVVEYDTGIR